MKILVFGKDSNPYQELLYGPMRAKGHTVRYLDDATSSRSLNLLLWPGIMLWRRLQGYKVLHLHWTFRFTLPWAGAFGRVLMQVYFMGWLVWTKVLGYRLVWTAHNVLPHGQRFAWDHAARWFLIRCADSVIVHSQAARDQMEQEGFSTAKTCIIPHGHYRKVYKKVPAKKARARLGIPADAFVVLFFGRIEAYKNVPAFVEACTMLAKNHPRLYVVIAGKCSDPVLSERLKEGLAALGGKAQLHARFIADEEVGLFLGAASVAVFPFERITTSGTVLAALSMGVPIVAPRVGGLAELPEGVGFWFLPGVKNGLQSALKSSLQEELLQKQQAAQRYASSLSWSAIAIATLNDYQGR